MVKEHEEYDALHPLYAELKCLQRWPIVQHYLWSS